MEGITTVDSAWVGLVDMGVTAVDLAGVVMVLAGAEVAITNAAYRIILLSDS